MSMRPPTSAAASGSAIRNTLLEQGPSARLLVGGKRRVSSSVPPAAWERSNEAHVEFASRAGGEKSKVYHFAGTKAYGTTKQGAYMCERDAIAAGDRAPKNEKHP